MARRPGGYRPRPSSRLRSFSAAARYVPSDASSFTMPVNRPNVTPGWLQPPAMDGPHGGVIMATVTENERTDPRSGEEKPAPPPENESVTEHTVQIGGNAVAYRAVARTTTLRSEEGEARASIFSIAYTRTDSVEDGARPLTFVFNGGPRPSSAWLPLRPVRPPPLAAPPPPPPPAAPSPPLDTD